MAISWPAGRGRSRCRAAVAYDRGYLAGLTGGGCMAAQSADLNGVIDQHLAAFDDWEHLTVRKARSD
jgi:hypothetical protein